MYNMMICTISVILLLNSGVHGESEMVINEDILKTYLSETTISEMSIVKLMGNLVVNDEKIFLEEFDVSFRKDGHISVLNLVFENQANLETKSIIYRRSTNRLTISAEKKGRVLFPSSNMKILQIFDEKMKLDTSTLETGEVLRIELIAPKEMNLEVKPGDYLNGSEVSNDTIVTGVGFMTYIIPLQKNDKIIQYVYQETITE